MELPLIEYVEALAEGVMELLMVSTLVELEFIDPTLESTSSSSVSEELLLVVSSSPSWRNSPPLIGGVKLSHGKSIRPIRYRLINRRVGAV